MGTETGKAPGSGQTRGRVLVVEDDNELRDMMAQLLDLEGFQSETASNGLDGLLKAHARRPDVIVLDLMMPVMDGWSFRVQQLLDTTIASVPVIVLSGASGRRSELLLEPHAVLQKPFDHESLLQAVRSACQPRTQDSRS